MAAAPNSSPSSNPNPGRGSGSGSGSSPEDAHRPASAAALASDGDPEEAEQFSSALHCSELARRQNEQRKLGLFCDVTLAFSGGGGGGGGGVFVGEGAGFELGAHRSVLAAATDYFTPLLGGQFSESVSRRVEMKEWSSEAGPERETVEGVVQFMYTGEIRVSTSNVHEVLELAD
ncbi:kelch-like protein 11, partial [Clarias magur]